MTPEEARNLTFTSALNSSFYQRCMDQVRKRCSEGGHDAYISCNSSEDYNMRSELDAYLTLKGFVVDHDEGNQGMVLRW